MTPRRRGSRQVAKETDQTKLARRFRAQGEGCGRLGSDLYAVIAGRAASDIESGGPVWEVVAPHASDPGGSMLALRLLGATHRMALTGAAPDLAAHYPSTGGDGDAEAAWRAWHALVSQRGDEVAPLLSRPVQTNEVGRAAALLGGFLAVARDTRMPLRILEIGASAGLNLRWDRFRFAAGHATWGPATSPVDLGNPFVEATPMLLPQSVDIAERRGCDVSPVDPTTDDGRLTLLCFVWPDQATRFRNLARACDVALEVPVALDTASADTWLSEQLARDGRGAATVVYHSVMLQYVDPAARRRLVEEIESAGRRARPEAPLAWLRMEPADTLASDMEVWLTTWPGGHPQRLAVAHPHGAWVRWIGT